MIGRIRFRLPGMRWGLWFNYDYLIPEEVNPRERCGPDCPLCPEPILKPVVMRISPPVYVPAEAWRTDHRYRCCWCGTVWESGPGTVSEYDECSECGSDYWCWGTWERLVLGDTEGTHRGRDDRDSKQTHT